MGLSLDLGLDLPDMAASLDLPQFEIEFAPAAELFDTGNEPFQILKALRDLGECEIECVTDKLVSLEQLSAETPYLYWKVTLSANVDPGRSRVCL